MRHLANEDRAGFAPALFFYSKLAQGGIFIKYTEEEIWVVHHGKGYTVINRTPILDKGDREERKAQIEKTLYAVFSKYSQRPKKR